MSVGLTRDFICSAGGGLSVSFVLMWRVTGVIVFSSRVFSLVKTIQGAIWPVSSKQGENEAKSSEIKMSSASVLGKQLC